ncbi:hypothetical protein [Butyricicoccus sp.]|uniref:hypothetical protein n=1 Tax=Butyricicoccus sp. TaxID=2049021 RepID=UPI003AAF407D
MTLDRAVAMIAAHLGVVDEEQINSMSFVFFDDVLTELGYKLTYEAISNYAGNSFCQKSWDMIEKSNPFHIGNPHAGVAMNSLAGFLAKSKITIMGGNQA